MEAPARTKGPRCGVDGCPSRWYEAGEDGYLYCENGHRKGDLLRGKDEDDFTTSQRARTTAKKDTDEDEKALRYLKGRKAVDLYLKSLQLILRHQLRFLVLDKGLPAELENVVYDLWALRIVQLDFKLADIRDHESQSQMFSTDESDSEADQGASQRPAHLKRLKVTPGLLDCLALCYLGIITLRLPFTPGDIHEWVNNGAMPYRTSIKYVPAAMKDRLPANYHAILEPNSLVNYKRFYRTFFDIAMSFEREHGVVWPALNRPLLLFRYLKELALPLELYDATTRMIELIKYDLTPPSSNLFSVSMRNLAEAQLVSCLVVCTKLLYPFDDITRRARKISEPASTAMDWDAWWKHKSPPKSKDTITLYTPEQLANLEEKDVFSMTGAQLNQYLDWYADTFIDEERIKSGDDGDFRSALYNFFPIDGPQTSQPSGETPASTKTQKHLEEVRAVQGSLKPRGIVPEDESDKETPRPGQMYSSYRKEEDLPEQAKRFYEEAAKIAGLSLDMLVRAVFFTEKKAEKWRKDQVRAGKEVNE